MKIAYEIAMIALAVVSIAILIIPTPPEAMLLADNIIVAVFMADYMIRFAISKDKKDFFRHNMIDLISALPFNAILKGLRIFKIFKVFKLAKLSRFARLAAVFSRFTKKVKPFLETNGFIYVLWCSAGLIVISRGE